MNEPIPVVNLSTKFLSLFDAAPRSCGGSGGAGLVRKGYTFMAVRIRLSRIGRKHVPFYRVVAVDSRKKRDGMCLDDIGTYDALKSKVIRFNMELFKKWMDRGAVLSDSALKVFRLHKVGSTAGPKDASTKKAVKSAKKAPAAATSSEAK